MSIRVNIPLSNHLTEGISVTEVNGSTVAECLKQMEKQFPRFIPFSKDGKLLASFSIYVNGESVYPEELDKPVKDGDELSVLLMLSGG